ncbi:MAG: hypothetical protein JWP89_5850 [Schlesneria sp.]|nr:hypothetical protein [Schlesneria sp.]
MHIRRKLLPLLIFNAVALVMPLCTGACGGVRVSPQKIELVGRLAGSQIVIDVEIDGKVHDFSRDVQYTVEPAGVVDISTSGYVRPLAEGHAVVRTEVRGEVVSIPVTVKQFATPPAVDFERDVMPVLSRYACNSGPCHGKQRGQNGFQLSLLGFDPDFDFEALAKEGRGRRVFAPAAERSLLLLKPIGELPHGGGKRIDRDSAEYRILADWITSGMSRQDATTIAALTGVSVEPHERVLPRLAKQQLRVTAKYSDGSTRDVTRLSSYMSNEAAVVAVNETGLMTAGPIVGDTAVMARYMGHIDVSGIAVPHPEPASDDVYPNLPRQNFIDDLVWTKLKTLGITPSGPCAEHTFLRRAYLDIVGRGPTASEAKIFLDDSAANKREALIDRLLAHPEYAEHWANKWTDLLRPNPYHVGIKATLAYDSWIRDTFRKNKPYDQFVRELLTARGSTFRDGNTVMFRDRRAPEELTTIVSQLFLGIRLECAKCHHHPFEVYGQDEFYSFAAYFAKLGRKGTGISAPISGSEEFIFAGTNGAVNHPLKHTPMTPKPLFGTAPSLDNLDDPREALAEWITSDQNDFFVQTMTNRVWADLMGRGFVDPIDDLRATNPPSNGPLLKALADDFRAQHYDIKQLIRRIATSHVYSLDSAPNDKNVADHLNFSRHYRTRLRAEVLLDTVSTATGVREDFEAMPLGSRAKELWTARIDSLFLDAFGRQDPNQDPPCERTLDTTIVQSLHLMNSNTLSRKVASDQSRVHELAQSDKTPAQIVEELYLSLYARRPATDELNDAVSLFSESDTNRRRVIEDLMWALINTPEFVFKD